MCVGIKEKRRKMYNRDTKISSPIRRGKKNDGKTRNTKMRRKKKLHGVCWCILCVDGVQNYLLMK